MPDLVSVITRRWKMMAMLTFGAATLAFLVCLLSPKQYASTATALAANPALSDKARIFNQNIQDLYATLGSPDDLDKIEGTAKLDTIYLALASDYNLVNHYKINEENHIALHKAAEQLKKNTTVNRTGYGELRIKVWDESSQMAADLANAAMQTLNAIHQQVQTETNRATLQRLKEDYTQKQQALQNSGYGNLRPDRHTPSGAGGAANDSLSQNEPMITPALNASLLRDQLAQYARLIGEYELALKTSPNALLVVEHARPSPYPDKPNTKQAVALAFVAALLFSFLLALFTESRNQKS